MNLINYVSSKGKIEPVEPVEEVVVLKGDVCGDTKDVCTDTIHDGYSVPTDTTQNVIVSTQTSNVCSSVPTDTITEMDIVEKLHAADQMDSSGDRFNRAAPFQARRKVQLAVLGEAWTALFSSAKCSDYSLKGWLNMAGDSAMHVYGVFEAVADRHQRKPIEGLVAYTSAVVKRWAEEGKFTDTPRKAVESKSEGFVNGGGQSYHEHGTSTATFNTATNHSTVTELEPDNAEKQAERKDYADKYRDLHPEWYED